MIYLRMFWEFLKTGLFAIGGGLATLPFLSSMGDRFGWFTQEELTNMLAVSESTPGPIGVNMATYVGSTVIGPLGGVLTTLGLILPSYIVILIVAKMMRKFSDNPFVVSSLRILRPVSVGMIAAAVCSVLMAVIFPGNNGFASLASCFSLASLILFAVLLALYIKFPKLHPVVILAIGAVVGIILKL